MNAIEHVRSALKDFLDCSIGKHFYGLEPFFRKLTTAKQHIENGELVSVERWQDLHDIALSKAVGDLLQSAGDWNERVREIRKQYKWDSMQGSLPDDLRTLFGVECDKLEEIRASARMILKAFPLKPCKYPGLPELYRKMKSAPETKIRVTYKLAAFAYRESLNAMDRPALDEMKRWLERPENQ